MFRKVFIISNCLFIGQIRQLICGACIERVAFAIVSIFQDHAETIGRLHKDLNDAGFKVPETRFNTCLPSDVKEDRSARLIITRVKYIALLKRSIGVGGVACFSREVINLRINSEHLNLYSTV